MTTKAARIEHFLDALSPGTNNDADRCYLGYFVCFNRGDYYEAHDVLEHLWLRASHPERDFYKGLIQLAGAFVHLKLQQAQPDHPVHGRRLAPAARLFALAHRNLAPFAPEFCHLQLEQPLSLAEAHLLQLASSPQNPWSPHHLPQLSFPNLPDSPAPHPPS